jgi:hypothetical protein
MRRICLLILSISSVLVSMAQVPQAFNYQAIGRRANGSPIVNQDITVRFSIIEGTALGPTIYQETHTTQTSTTGLFMLSIGQGTVISGTFAAIPWETGNKYLKVEIALGGTVYLVQGTTQLLSVPYALYSERSKLLAGNNTVTVNGNTIMGNYQAANNTITITGNLIGGNYKPAADSTIRITGNVIGGNYKAANNTILVNGNSIAGNYQAGTGINIAGNVISSTAAGSNLWVTDAQGIHNATGGVGIGTNSSTSSSMLTIQQVATGGSSGAMDIFSSDTYHTVTRFRNTSVNQEWQFHVGGSSNNNEIHAGAFGISNNTAGKWLLTGDAATGYMSIGSVNFNSNIPKSRLHVFEGDVNIDRIGSGIIMKSPNGQCWRITIDDTGNLVRTAIACP